jgi:hypothetical protein
VVDHQGQKEMRFDLGLVTQESQEYLSHGRWDHAALLQGSSGLRDAMRTVPGPLLPGEQPATPAAKAQQNAEVKAWLKAYCRWYLGILRKAIAGADF